MLDSKSEKKKLKHEVLKNLASVESDLQMTIDLHRHGKYGFISREWGFIAPGGLGNRLGGKFRPWEEKLLEVKNYFWPIEAYEAMEEKPFGKPDASANLSKEAEQIYGNTPLHMFLMEAPEETVELKESDMESYRDAARIFLLLGTLSHLVGNSGPKNTELPSWIEDPLIMVAKRLGVEPTLTGHFLVQENWLWRSALENKQNAQLNRIKRRRRDRAIAQTLLDQCDLQDRRHRIKIYPNCFIGSQAVDVLVDNGFSETRTGAVHLGRRINKAFKLFSHVTGDHPLMDKHLFYRFKKKWRNKSKRVLIESAEEDDLGDESNHEDDEDDDDDDEYERKKTSRLMRPADLFNLSYTGVGMRTSDLFNLSYTSGVGGDRRKSSWSQNSRTARFQLAASLGHFGSFGSSKSGSQASLTGFEDDLRDEEQVVAAADLGYENADEDAIRQPRLDDEIMAAIGVMGSVKVKDRRYHFRTYKQCFVGSQLIDVLIQHRCATSRQDALALALEINERYSILEHVCGDHRIKDQHLFYRFTDVFCQFMSPTGPPLAITTGGNASTSSSEEPKSPKSAGKRQIRFFDERKHSDDSMHSGVSLGSTTSYDTYFGAEETEEFRFETIDMLYPAFRNNHERVNQLIPTLMGYALRSLPFLIPEVLSVMRTLLDLELNEDLDASTDDNYETKRLSDLLYQMAFCVSRCKEQFQLMSTDPTKRTFNSKHVSIRQTQPLSNGVLVRREKGGEPKPSKGTTGTQFPYFHLLDWLLGRHQYARNAGSGLVAKIAAVDDTYPRPQRDYIQSLMRLGKDSTLRGFIEIIGCPPNVVTAYNHLVECYAGEGGLLQAHCRKLYSYIHNDVQSSTSGTNHLSHGGEGGGHPSGCPMSSAYDNHLFAKMMFGHMRKAADERWRLRLPPLMCEAKKIVYSTSESGGFTTVALDLSQTGMLYEYGDVVKVLLPNHKTTTSAWIRALAPNVQRYFRLEDMSKLSKDTSTGWGWDDLWEALGWSKHEENGRKGVPLELLVKYIEQGQILDEAGKSTWINCPMDMTSGDPFASPPDFSLESIGSLEPVSPRVYSVSGVEADRVFLLISKPQDGAKHHGYDRMSDKETGTIHCSFSPATFFLVPAKGVNLVCVASGTGISPFAGLVDAIGSRQGTYTIVHQCKSSDLFLANSQTWLDFTTINPGAVVYGYISGDRSRRNCPMRYVIRNGAFEETSLLGRHNSSAYYFECSLFQSRLKEIYHESALNLAYCCGGVQSAIQPLKDVFQKNKMDYEFTCESYGVPATLREESAACQIGGTIVNLDYVSPIHVGGDQILQQLQDIKMEDKKCQTPDHSEAFAQLHPHAYNLLRCLRTPEDADFDAFNAFMQRQAMSKSVMFSMATKYAQVALAAPKNSKVVRIASELQAKSIRHQVRSGDSEAAQKSAEYLKALLDHVPKKDADANRWNRSLEEYRDSCNQEAFYSTRSMMG